MKGILKLYSQYGDKIIIIPVLCIILCMVTYFIHIITKKSRFPKYLPGLAFIIFGIFKFKSGWKNLVYSSGLQDLWIFTLVFTSGFVAICFALILGTLSKKKKTKKIIKNKRKREAKLKNKKIEVREDHFDLKDKKIELKEDNGFWEKYNRSNNRRNFSIGKSKPKK